MSQSIDVHSCLTVTVHEDGRATWSPRGLTRDAVVRDIRRSLLRHYEQERLLLDAWFAVMDSEPTAAHVGGAVNVADVRPASTGEEGGEG